MKLTAFVMYISNPQNLLQRSIYEKYLTFFDVVDAVMCDTGECLVTCVSRLNITSDLPICFETFITSERNDGICNFMIIDRDDYENLEKLQDSVFNTVEKFNDINLLPQY
ncbi:hypothetical protein Hesp105 [Hemileuca sp. nucleopolyhedrovirus]|uniref:Ac117 n=1 Tax=Hemileuca sp. nucleopolyhedrovirus TaxID=1367203 RepID=S5N9D3_9ABAC|nr:hypothetical protein Hesp105 [Hemileuca sp. nucleopolyhedrovirus]AGR56857.1 hypothetical protein Hesp105 [Hemileuca sp. nucleopolyhedrovirus]